MLKYLKKDRWSPYIVGVLIASLSMFSFIFLQKMLGTTRTILKGAIAIWTFINPQHVQDNVYYSQILKDGPFIDWQFTLVIGIFLGSLLAGRLYKKSPTVHVPQIWKERFGKSRAKRYLGAFLGGVIILFGARLADGCTSGHAISGGMQLALTSWVFMLGVFGLGIPSALIIYKRKKGA